MKFKRIIKQGAREVAGDSLRLKDLDSNNEYFLYMTYQRKKTELTGFGCHTELHRMQFCNIRTSMSMHN